MIQKTINKIKTLASLSASAVILLIFFADVNAPAIKPLIAGTVVIGCALQYYFLDKLAKQPCEKDD